MAALQWFAFRISVCYGVQNVSPIDTVMETENGSLATILRGRAAWQTQKGGV
jgi:hypothetical protein